MSSQYEVSCEEIVAISGTDPRRCMKCGRCSASCPAYEEMEYHPHQFSAMVENGRVEELMKSNAIFHCMSCLACVERCPRNVAPAKLIEAVRLAVIRKQGMSHLVPDDIPSHLDTDLPQQAIVSAMRKFTK